MNLLRGLVALSMSVPLLWTLLTAFKSDAQLAQASLELWPSPWQWDNFSRSLQVVPMHRYTWNTLLLALAVSLAHLWSCPLAAYALVRMRGQRARWLRALTLAALVVPYPALMVPQFVMFQKLGLVNSAWPLILPSFLGNPFYILFLMRTFAALPRELEEAARLDGAGPLTVLTRVVLPLSQPALVAMVVLTIAHVWNDFLGPLLYLQDPSLYTVNLGLQFYRDTHQVSWNLMMAATLMALAPVVLLFLLAQRAFTSSTVSGAGK